MSISGPPLSPEPATAGNLRWWLLVWVLTALGLTQHLVGIDALLPHAAEPDTLFVVQANMLRGEDLQNDAAWAKYPHVLGRLLALVPRSAELASVAPEEELAAHAAQAGRDLRSGRYLVAVLAAALVPLTWVLARLFLAAPWAFLATLLCATSLMLQNFAQQARPHAAYAAFTLAAVLAWVPVRRRGDLRSYLLAGVASGLAVGALHSGAFVLLGGAVAHALRTRGAPRREHAKILVPLILLAVSVWSMYPFLFDTPPSQGAFATNLGTYEFPHRVKLAWFNGGGFPKLALAFWSYDPVLLFLGAAGALLGGARVVLRWRRTGSIDKDLLVVAVPVLALFLVLGIYANIFSRFAIPLIPYLACLAVLPLRALARAVEVRVQHPQLARSVIALTCILAVAFPGALSARLAWLRTRADTYTLAARWITEHVDPRSETVAVHVTVPLPLFQDVRQDPEHDPQDSLFQQTWFKYQARLGPNAIASRRWPVYPLAPGGRLPLNAEAYPRAPKAIRTALDELDPTWAITDHSNRPASLTRAAIRERMSRLETSFSPWIGAERDPAGLRYESDSMWIDVLNARTVGPVLEVYRLESSLRRRP
jgi:hypothetical protein